MSTTNTKVQVFGHQWAIDLLIQQADADHVPHALLITGPVHVGKSTVARFFAQYLNCQGAPKPCGACGACRKIAGGNHADVRIWDSDDEAIKIDEVRELQHELSLSPYEGQYRVALLCNFERATLSAANALLKTLEEPASQVVLILTATDPGALLPTIVSRCQVLALRSLAAQEMTTTLKTHWQADAAQAELLTQLAAGRLGWAARALEDNTLLDRRAQHLQDLLNLLAMNRADRLAFAYDLSHNPAHLKETLSAWLTIWRDLLLLRSGSQTKIINLDWQDTLQKLAHQHELAHIETMVIKLRAALNNLEQNVNARLNLETVLLKMPVITTSIKH
jgi:DNA polymerase-3 subunit delta'